MPGVPSTRRKSCAALQKTRRRLPSERKFNSSVIVVKRVEKSTGNSRAIGEKQLFDLCPRRPREEFVQSRRDGASAACSRVWKTSSDFSNQCTEATSQRFGISCVDHFVTTTTAATLFLVILNVCSLAHVSGPQVRRSARPWLETCHSLSCFWRKASAEAHRCPF